MSGWMPILSQDHMIEGKRQAIDDFDDSITVRDCQRTSGTEIILHVDNQQNIVMLNLRR